LTAIEQDVLSALKPRLRAACGRSRGAEGTRGRCAATTGDSI